MISITYALCLLAFVALKAYALDDRSFNQTDADDYLEKYGYLNGLSRRSGLPQQRQLARTRAIATLQQFLNLPVTGQLDETTRKAMRAPRCGMKDVGSTKRSGDLAKWDVLELNWAFRNPTRQLNAATVRTAIKQALDIWSKITPLQFNEVPANSPMIDLIIDFGTSQHQDCTYNFDGDGGVLAHAMFPRDGRLHFDDDEKWAFNDGAKVRDGYTDFLWVATHELGHALGLPHTDKPEDIMYPVYNAPELDSNGKIKPLVLSQVDIQAMQRRYGPKGNSQPPPVRPPLPTPTGGACPRFDAAVTGFDGSLYFFTGNIGWKKASLNAPANSAKPFYIDQLFLGVKRVTATATTAYYGIFLLFEGRKVHSFDYNERRGRFQVRSEYPKDLPSNIPFEPEGSFVTRVDMMYLYRGDQCVMYDYYGNNARTGVTSVKQEFGTLPANAKVSFYAEEYKAYFLDANNAYLYDFQEKKVISTKPIRDLITC